VIRYRFTFGIAIIFPIIALQRRVSHASAAKPRGREKLTSSVVPAQTSAVTKKRLAAGYVITSLVVLFMIVDTVMKVLQLPPAVQATIELGYPAQTVLWIGLIELICVGLYILPRTSVLGAILLTGYLGGAIATHVRVGNPLLSHALFPIYIGIMVWGGLYLRETRLRDLLYRSR
jgi:hypothetical protein